VTCNDFRPSFRIGELEMSEKYNIPPEIEQNMSHAMLGGTKQFKL
jgi:hypothetical protein